MFILSTGTGVLSGSGLNLIMTTNFHFQAGSAPLLISIPHAGTTIPSELAADMEDIALLKADTDWHLHLLYKMAHSLGASVIRAEYSRYVIDLNRPREDSNLYPGQDTTGLCPVDTFTKQPLYRHGRTPGPTQIAQRIEQYWQPYHDQLNAELARIRGQHGVAVLWDAHSIASVVPRFFSGKLPDLNFGTADSRSCDPALERGLKSCMQNSPLALSYSHVFNGRFKGGHITRHYGQPTNQIHAIQLEMVQCLYMNEEAPFAYRPDLAAAIQPLLTELLSACLEWAHGQSQP